MRNSIAATRLTSVIHRAVQKAPGTAPYLLPWARRLPTNRMVHRGRGGRSPGHRHQEFHQIARYALEIICQSRFANTPNKRASLACVDRVVVERGRQGHRDRGWHAGLTALKCVADCLTQAMTRKSPGSVTRSRCRRSPSCGCSADRDQPWHEISPRSRLRRDRHGV